MKKCAFLTAALILSLALAGCTGGNKTDNADTQQDESVATTAEVVQYDENFTDADKSVDMNAIDGKKAKTADAGNAKGEIDGAEVVIGDAVVIDNGEGKAIIVSFEFKNNTATDISFSTLLSTDANQEDAYLTPSIMLRTEGFVPETFAQTVGTGDKITVQRAFDLYDDETPVTITVESAVNSGDARVEKTFNIK